ncbi:hypothetical protein [Gluconobacter roseus]|uniref:hypothetical protein n=1 Tax=Gluconobacter roseus TaxID=586239 RepID=UPI0038D1FAD4
MVRPSGKMTQAYRRPGVWLRQKETRLLPGLFINSPDLVVPAWAEDLHLAAGMDWVSVVEAALVVVDWATHWGFEGKTSSSPFQG